MKAVKFLCEHLPSGASEDHNESPWTGEPVSSRHRTAAFLVCQMRCLVSGQNGGVATAV